MDDNEQAAIELLKQIVALHEKNAIANTWGGEAWTSSVFDALMEKARTICNL